MQVFYPRCAGLDVHKDTIAASVRRVSAPQPREVRSFAAATTGTSSQAASSWSWPMPATFATFLDARPTSTTRRGLPICSRMA